MNNCFVAQEMKYFLLFFLGKEEREAAEFYEKMEREFDLIEKVTFRSFLL